MNSRYRAAAVEAGCYDTFFNPLVGDEARTASLTEALAVGVRVSSRYDPYDVLQQNGLNIVRRTINNHCRLETDDKRTRRIWSFIGVNAALGIQISVGALRTVGTTYKDLAEAPQLETGVSRSVHRALGTAYGIAFSGRWVGYTNIHALRRGFNPNASFSLARALTATSRGDSLERPNFNKGFIATKTSDGQISIDPRYKRKVGKNDRHCPATESHPEQRAKSPTSLWLLMKVMGEVAMTEIYPEQFDIIARSRALAEN